MKQFLRLVVVACFSVHAWAAPASDASIDELLMLMKAGTQMDTMAAPMRQAIRQSMEHATKGKPLSPEREKAMAAYLSKTTDIIREEFNWDRLKPLMIEVYRETYDQEEIDGLIAFYKTPAGRAFVDKMPALLQKSMVMSQRIMQTALPKLTAAMQDAGDTLKNSK